MKGKLFLWTFVALVLAVPALGALTDNNTAYYSFDDGDRTGNTIHDLSGNSNNGTNVAGNLAAVGIINESVDFNGSTDISYFIVELGSTITGASEKTFNYWVYVDAVTGDDYLMDSLSGGDRFIIGLNVGGSGNYHIYDGAWDNTGQSIGTGAWHMITVSTDSAGTAIKFYYDGSNVYNVTQTARTIEQTPVIGASNSGAGAFLDGRVDEVSVFRRQLSDAEVLELYNSGAAYNPYSAPAGTETVTLINPPDNDFNDTYGITFTYNTTNTTGEPDNCTLYLDGAVNTTDTTITPNADQQINVTFTADGSYSWNIGCSYTGTEYNATARTITLDTVQPTINTGNLYNLKPVPIGILGSSLLTGQINLSDTNLYSLNISTDVEQIYYNNTLSPLTTFNYTLSHNVSTYSTGLHTLTIKAADGHTAKRIDEYNYKRSFFGKELEFDFRKDEWLFDKDYVRVAIDKGSLNTHKLSDRYVFDWEDSVTQGNVLFTVTSDHYIDIVQQSSFKGHLVVPSLDKWIDFELENPNGFEEYTVQRISDNEVQVHIAQLNRKTARFQSIGDLNINTINYTFYVINATETYVSPVVEGSTNTFTLDFTANGTYTITGSLYYNGTAYAGTKTTNTTNQVFTYDKVAPNPTSTPTNYSFYWNFTIQDPSTNYTNVTTTQNQEVHHFLIDDCTSYTTASYNMTFLDEEAFTAVTVNASVLIEYNYTNKARTYGDSFTNKNSLQFCISPAWANFTGDITLQYSSGSASRDFLTDDTQFDNDTVYQNIYLLTSGGTDITINIKDTNDVSQSGAVVEAWRYNLSNAVYYLVESEITDIDGRAVFTLVQNDPFYKFIVKQDGTQVLETTRFKITQTEYTLYIGGASTSPIAKWIAARSIDSSLTYTNATKTITFTWTDADSAASMYCLNVTYGNLTPVTSSCSTNSDSSLSYVITNTNASYFAQGIAFISGEAKVLESLSVDLSGIWQNFGKNFSIGLAFLVMLVISLMFLHSPTLGVVGSVVGITTLYLIGLVPVGLTALLGFAAVGMILIFLMRERMGA